MDHFHDLKQQQSNPKPIFDVIEPSMVRAQFSATKKDASFPSYLYQSKNQQNKFVSQIGQQSSRGEDVDQISIFDAAKYFSGLHDHDDKKEQPPPSKGGGVINHLPPVAPPRLSSVSSSVDDTVSNYGGRSTTTCTSNNTYRARSFHATPTISSEASWNSQAGLLSNPPGYTGVNLTKTLSPNSSSNNSSAAPRWPRISAKWLIPRRKCPCSGKKSVEVEEGVEFNTPRMVDLRRSTSNGSATNFIPSSWYSPRQNSSKIIGTTTTTSPTTNVVTTPQEPRKINNSNFSVSAKIPNVSNQHHSNPNVVGPLKSFTNNSEIISPSVTTATATTTTTTATIGGTTTSTTTNGFTFPILENSPLGVKKMFTVIAADPPRDSLEVFQPRSHPISPSKSRRTSYEDDNVLSDGSSDLFEIDSFSTSYNNNPCNRDSLDELLVVHPASSLSNNASISTMKKLGITCSRSNNSNVSNNNVGENDDGVDHENMTHNTECYAPSEASIDWSVTTAEGFDRGSVMSYSGSASDVGVYAAMRRESERNNGGGGGGKGEEKMSSRKGGGLLGCRCEKAVSVGPGPIKCSAEGAHRSRRGM